MTAVVDRAAGVAGAPTAATHDTYEALGIRRVINANAALTRLGGSLMPSPVLDAMRRAAGAFVDMHALQVGVSAEIARLTRNEAAFVCAGASAGLVLSALACITGDDLRSVARLIDHGAAALPRHEVVVQCVHRNPYDPALRLAGARIVQAGNALQTFEWELAAAITERTAAVLYLAGPRFAAGALPLETVLRVAHAAGVPVVVDAAAQLPPVENLWRFTEMGADLVVFSGGKALRGPQASGVVLGRAALVEAIRVHASPHQRLARAMKTGKEEMMGLLAAVRWYLAQDHAAVAARNDSTVAGWVASLGSLAGVTVRRDLPGEAGQPVPRALVTLDPSLGILSAAVQAVLLTGDPAIDIATAGPYSLFLNPEWLEPGEETVVATQVAAAIRVLTRRSGSASR